MEAPQKPIHAFINTPDTEYEDLDLPLPIEEPRANRYYDESPNHEPHGRGAGLAQSSDPEKSPGLHSVSTNSLKEYDRRTSQSPRKHRSGHGRGHERNISSRDTYDEAEFYKYGRAAENGYYDRRENDYKSRRCCCSSWSRRRKCVVFGLIALSVIVLIVIIALAVALTHKGFNYTPSTAQVNNTAAFASGGATRKSVNDTNDGSGNGTDTYTYYHGDASNFPNNTRWITFKDMWTNNLDTFKYSCGWLGRGDDNTPEMIQDIYNAIQDRANASLVDHRIILATIIQETNGCPLVPHTTRASRNTLRHGDLCNCASTRISAA